MYKQKIFLTLVLTLTGMIGGVLINLHTLRLPFMSVSSNPIVQSKKTSLAGSRSRGSSSGVDMQQVPVAHIKDDLLDVTDKQFFVMKFQQPTAYDIVIGGDSRTLCDISPASMKEELGGLKIYNFAYRAQCWTEDYMDKLQSLLKKDSTKKIIVLGISPLEFTPKYENSNGYLEIRKLKPIERMQILKADKSLRMFQALNDPNVSPEMTYVYHADGWRETSRPKTESEHEKFRRMYAGLSPSPKIVDGFMRKVQDWRRAGIVVVGFRIPTSDRMASLENQLSKVDGPELLKRFRQMGGVWLLFQGVDYHYDDGHHMDVPSARKFSKDLGKKINDILSRKAT